MGVSLAAAGDARAADEAWTAVAQATPRSAFRGGDVTRLDLLGALALEKLGRRSELDHFGNGQEGAMARLLRSVRQGARNDADVASALADAVAEMDDMFRDVEGRLLRRALSAAAGR